MQELDITLFSRGQLHTIQKFFTPKELKTVTHVSLLKNSGSAIFRSPQNL